MFENQSFETIVERMLERIRHNVDKREGSIIYDAGSMTAKELQEMYIALDGFMLETFPETASRSNLIKRAAEYGVYPYKATHAVLKGVFNIDIPLDSRFSLDELNYKVIQRTAPKVYEVECETAGTIGNTQFGSLIPIEYIEGLQTAELTELLIPGEDEEETEAFRRRFFLTRKQIPYGGNRDDYLQKVMAIQGVGGVKSYRAPMGGGTVGITIIDSDFNPPASALINEVQTILDPIINSGKGLGVAPYGHRVTVSSVEEVVIDIETNLTLSSTTIGQVKDEVEEIIKDYLLTLRKAWMDSDFLIVRKAQIESRILDVEGVHDITNTLLNSLDENVTLTQNQVPILGSVIFHE